MISSFKQSHEPTRVGQRRVGFTLVELLIGMAVIGILIGMLTFGAQRVIQRTREFQIQTEMNQLESAIQQFQTQFGFFPPSFKEMEDLHFVDNDPEAAANLMLTYLNRIAPSNVEGGGTFPDRPVDIWWAQVGSIRTAFNDNAGSDLAFWLSGVAKNKQRPLTSLFDVDDDGNLDIVPNLAHGNSAEVRFPGFVEPEKHTFYEFRDEQALRLADANGFETWIQYNQPVGVDIPYLYLDRRSYLPSRRSVTDGAYCRGGEPEAVYEAIEDRTLEVGSNEFELVYPNADSFQLITFGIDGMPGDIVSDIPEFHNCNVYLTAGIQGADNLVNFGSSGPTKLEAIILEDQSQ